MCTGEDMLGIISDTHGSVKDFYRALEIFKAKGVSHILHMGDVLYHGARNPLPESYNPKEMAETIANMKEMTFIKGNCDSEVDEMVTDKDISQPILVLEREGYKFFCIHGHQGSEDDLVQMAINNNCDALIYGHSHIKRLKDKEIAVVNPGSTTFPKDDLKSIATYSDGVFELIELESGKTIDSLKL